MGSSSKFAPSGVCSTVDAGGGAGGERRAAAPCRGHAAGVTHCQYSSSPVTAEPVSAGKANYFSSRAQQGPRLGPSAPPAPPAGPPPSSLILGAVANAFVYSNMMRETDAGCSWAQVQSDEDLAGRQERGFNPQRALREAKRL